jgi:DNA invertase Pin-like site-specific DNA recombinase
MTNSNNYVSYLRVSTKKQGSDGLGIDSQRLDVNKYINSVNGNLAIEFIEVESGTKINRKELQKAIDYCQINKATLVVSRLDRLARNAKFLFTLLDSKVNIIFADMPNTDLFTIKVLALIAEKDVQRIRENTKKALNAKKQRGEKVGNAQNLEIGRIRSIETKKENAKICQYNKRAFAMISALKIQGLSFRQIAENLNANGFRTRNNSAYSATQIIRIYNTFNVVSNVSVKDTLKVA